MSGQFSFPDSDIHIGIDIGTLGGSLAAYKANTGECLGVGTADYGYSLAEGSCFEQDPDDWRASLPRMMESLRTQVSFDPAQVKAIGVGAQMHGFVLCDHNGRPVSVGGRKRGAILWNDQERGKAESDQLARAFNQPFVTRHTVSRMKWSVIHDRPAWDAAKLVTVPSSYVGYLLTGVLGVGPGDASGMVGQVGSETLFLERDLPRWATELPGITEKRLPRVGQVGEILGGLDRRGAELLGLPEGIPVAYPEGDQPIGMIASGTVRTRRASVSLGTSWVFNAYGGSPVLNQRGMVDSFRTANGGHLLMSCLSSGCGVLDAIATLLSGTMDIPLPARHALLTERAQAVPPGSYGAVWLPFFSGEGLAQNPHPFGLLHGLTMKHTDPGILYRSAVESQVQLLRIGHGKMGRPSIDDFSAYGGGSKNPLIVQAIADIFNATARKPANSHEAATWGAAVLAGFAVLRAGGHPGEFEDFVESRVKISEVVKPNREHAAVYSMQNDAVNAALQVSAPLFALADHPFHKVVRSM